jgi:hypothetical protein
MGFGWISCFGGITTPKAGTLTVAGQWRSFTAFPNILTIAVIGALPFVSSLAATDYFP